MLKRRTILVGLAALGLKLGVSTQVHGQSTSCPEAWQSVYNEGAAGATTIVTVPLLNSFSPSILQVVFKLAGYWGG
ncbi:hypothetical protein H6G96_30470 [Nostoc sp. FACHB-892]|uniref:hypothetical protein n=1 Tax=Nostoc sp. FACHB-892 TaxID=2692843 RepID=UPI001689EB5A|nr:hypothetical protein [Nostoc sp. FACHB-892]MBD2730524.1 hypothetical protein [Nostoc sp. FACHB-892]